MTHRGAATDANSAELDLEMIFDKKQRNWWIQVKSNFSVTGGFGIIAVSAPFRLNGSPMRKHPTLPPCHVMFCRRISMVPVVLCLCGLIFQCEYALHGQQEKESEDPPKKIDPQQLKGLIPAEGGAPESTSEGYWLIDAEKAFAQARKENKSVLINFTGSDWCSWCIKLEGEVFSKPDFSKDALEEFVFLKLDFPSDKSNQSKKEISQNEELKTKFGVAGFPSIYVCDSQGRPVAKTGYLAGGPAKYLTHLRKFREKLIERNELFALAAKESGAAKAELLDRGLGLMDEGIATSHYEDVIKQIVTLDKENKLGLRGKYYAAQDAEERRRILEKVDVVVNSLPPQAALIEIEKAMKEIALPANSKIDALQQKLYLLKSLQRNNDADRLLDEMVSLDGLTDDRRERILIQKAYNFVETKRNAAALVFLDEKINTYPQNAALVTAKGEILDMLEDHEKAVEAYDAAILLSGGSESMAEIIAMKAYALVALERVPDAIEVFQAFIDSDEHPDFVKADLLIQKAMLLREVGRTDAAELAEKQALERAESEEQKSELTELIRQLQEIE